MRGRRPPRLPILLAVFLPLAASAQDPPTYQLDLRKDYVAWNWSGAVDYAPLPGLRISDRFRSTLYQQVAERDQWRDENTLEVRWRRPLGARLQSETQLSSRYISDDNTSREFSTAVAAQGLRIALHPNITLSPSLGWTVEDAFDEQDGGWYLHNGLRISRLDMGGYLNHTDVNSVIRAIPGRRNQEHTLYTAWSKRFSEYASDSLRVGYQFSENRSYVAPPAPGLPTPQEQVIINARFIYNQIDYRFSPRSVLAIATDFRSRSLDQQRPVGIAGVDPDQNIRKELALSNRIDHTLATARFRIQNGFTFSQTTNDNDPGVETDISALQAAFNHAVFFQPTANSQWYGKFSYSKFEYNPPEISDQALRRLQSTRDELRFYIDSGYRHRFSPWMTWTLNGTVTLFHQIYLREGRSQNNNWNRVYQLGSAVDHTISPRVAHRLQARVLANYTVFDFDNNRAQIRSFVFRKFQIRDSLAVRLSDDLTATAIYQLEREDNGTFFKNDFTQRLTKELTAHFANAMLQYRGPWGIQLGSGVTVFRRHEWGFSGEGSRQRTRRYTSITPRMTVTYAASGRLMLFLSYSPNRSENRTRPITRPEGGFEKSVQYYTSGSIQMQYWF